MTTPDREQALGGWQTIELPYYCKDADTVALMRAGFEAFVAGKPSNASPYEPSRANGWWQTGWDAAAITSIVSPPAPNTVSTNEVRG